MNNKMLSVTIIILYGIAAIAGLMIRDLSWVIVGLLGMAIMYIPIRKSHSSNMTYARRLLAMHPIPLILFIIIAVIGDAGLFEPQWRFSLVMQAITCMNIGYLAMVCLDIFTESVMTKRWLLVYSLLFACTLAFAFTFYVFVDMYFAGYPLFNEQFANMYDDNFSNGLVMSPTVITTVMTILYAVIVRFYLRNVPKESITVLEAAE